MPKVMLCGESEGKSSRSFEYKTPNIEYTDFLKYGKHSSRCHFHYNPRYKDK